MTVDLQASQRAECLFQDGSVWKSQSVWTDARSAPFGASRREPGGKYDPRVNMERPRLTGCGGLCGPESYDRNNKEITAFLRILEISGNPVNITVGKDKKQGLCFCVSRFL